MKRIFSRATVWAAALVIVGSLPAMAIPVISPWGSDTFAKAIHFTSASKPSSVSYGNGTLGSVYRGTGGTRDSGIIMSPVGDGSYVCTAALYPGGTYTYYFGFRNRTWEPDTTTSFLTNTTPGERDQDVNRLRSITIPSSAAHGYYIYNAYGDASVIGFQAPNGDTSVMTTLNPYLRTIAGTGDTAGLARIGTEGGDTIFANMSASNTYSLDCIQTGDSQFTMSWSFSIGGTELYAPSVQGAHQFGGVGGSTAVTNGYTSKNYGFRIWRCDSPAGGVAGAVFTDVTNRINGDTNWADNDLNSFNGQSFVDTSMPDTASNFLYLVTFYNAYGHLQSDTTRQTGFSGGYDTQTRAGAIRVFFIVEHYNEDVVFPNGENVGRVYLTPVIDGERRPDLRMPAPVARVQRRSIS